ncbi:MAG: cytochrome c oxidase subunit II [Mesorhizobium sp.]|uniref:cytochrome c oxidase subunit II n=1 Tax=Mesorhizobium sp. TaxID=1871066 RepID=UPI000FE33434|nr:cytochrome c oxidase subunit II [Mesorhizobium sp.]RWJ04864.1 MAG: cytochrome c oxidase subunit II [Mesorhizobium sp.]RWJ11984.1 MAG: cytochrome c oxidase subunit II [Mesorhizobium sp.]
MRRSIATASELAALAHALTGCSGVQSALDPAGAEAGSIATLFWVMAVVGAAIWTAVTATLLCASRERRRLHSEAAAGHLILWGGAIFPSVILVVLLGYAVWLIPDIRPWSQGERGGLRIEVVGEQYWWRVKYLPAGGGPAVESANEVRLPVGERVDFTLQSADVIHSFWIPSLGGKMDMVPGRVNRLSLKATKSGTYRGACAEFCGTSHALMAFTVLAMEPADFSSWLARRASPSENATAPGYETFTAQGCAACHAVRGTDADGRIGPDLSHVGSRATIAAGILKNDESAIARFVSEPDVVKPGALMPAFGMLPTKDIAEIAAYLEGLQ